jgi:hypothetical protein
MADNAGGVMGDTAETTRQTTRQTDIRGTREEEKARQGRPGQARPRSRVLFLFLFLFSDLPVDVV